MDVVNTCSPANCFLDFREISSGDTHWALRSRFVVTQAGPVTLRIAGAGWFEVFVDGTFAAEGPVRFEPSRPEWQDILLQLEAGEHLLAIHWHDMRLTTRLQLAETPPFLSIAATAGGERLPLAWRGHQLTGYRRTGRRLGCVLGWVEWADTRANPVGWTGPGFDDSAWQPIQPGPRPDGLGEPGPSQIGPMRYFRRRLVPHAQGELVNMSIVEHDPPMNFVVRKLQDSDLPANGCWWRFDLRRIQLGRPEITLCLPAGALVQIAYAESLIHGRVYPYLAGSGGDDSCMLDTWVARGGRQSFKPLHPKGARFLEVHVLAPPDQVDWLEGSFTERCYYPEQAEGSFLCGDPLLERIWQTGVDSLRSCAEDAITDNPTRERGQWLGDATGPGMEIVSCTQRDHRPLVRGLRQAAQCALPDGMIPAIFPGTREFLPSFAIQWVAAIPRYYRRSGNRAVFEELYPAARKIVEAFQPDRVQGGIKRNPNYWNFIDWGYTGSSTVFSNGRADEGQRDPALSLFYLRALRSLTGWAQQLGEPADDTRERAHRLEQEIRETWLADYTPQMGFHASALALRENLLHDAAAGIALQAVKNHIRDCFPYNPDAPRLESVHVESTRLITPFFLHFALPVLIEQGEAAFVYETIRRCWGWMLERGATTWYEVFDPRWSHCHQWSGCPTWILTRYGLGLSPRFDKAPARFVLDPHPGALERANGQLPHPQGGAVKIAWDRDGANSLQVRLSADHPVSLETAAGNPIGEGTQWSGDVALTTPAQHASTTSD